jgi:hypothetical protein
MGGVADECLPTAIGVASELRNFGTPLWQLRNQIYRRGGLIVGIENAGPSSSTRKLGAASIQLADRSRIRVAILTAMVFVLVERPEF